MTTFRLKERFRSGMAWAKANPQRVTYFSGLSLFLSLFPLVVLLPLYVIPAFYHPQSPVTIALGIFIAGLLLWASATILGGITGLTARMVGREPYPGMFMFTMTGLVAFAIAMTGAAAAFFVWPHLTSLRYVGTHAYAVPMQYNPIGAERPDQSYGFSFRLCLPSLSAQYSRDCRQSGSPTTVSLGPPTHFESALRQFESQRHRLEGPEDFQGRKRYRSRSSTATGVVFESHYLLEQDSGGNPVALVRCSGPTGGKKSCGYTALTEGMTTSARIPFEAVGEWRQIDGQLRELAESWRVPAR